MQELLILSGKGGAGKTSLAACFAKLSTQALFIDCDVDASNLPLLLEPVLECRENFYAGNFPVIDPAKCNGCSECIRLCPFDAMRRDNGKLIADGSCEGCGVCADSCKQQAITLQEELVGYWMRSETAYGKLFHAELRPGAENSGKLIARLRAEANEFAETSGCKLIISDGPPGIGCPVISASTGVDNAVVVTEPTISGIHDMERLAALLKQFEIPFAVIINKADLNLSNSEKVRSWCGSNTIPLLGEIPFDHRFSEALSAGKTILDLPDSPAAQNIKHIWENLQKFAEI